MPGPKFFETRMGRTFYEGTVPRIARALEALGAELRRHNDSREEAEARLRGEYNPPYDPAETTGPALDANNPNHDLVHGAAVSVCGEQFEVAVHEKCPEGDEDGSRTVFLVAPDDYGDVGWVYCPVCQARVQAPVLEDE